MRKVIPVIILSALQINIAQCQAHVSTVPSNKLQAGISAKLLLEITKKYCHPRISINAGAALPVFKYLYPSVNIELDVYNGGLGTRSGSPLKESATSSDLIVAVTATAGGPYTLKGKSPGYAFKRNVPLQYFANFITPALQNPYDYSLSAGVNYIYALDSRKVHQKVGFIDGHVLNAQLGYYNDGGPLITGLNLGDHHDRYYTGGGFINVTLNPTHYLNNFEISYHKYTGYSKNAFELTNKMGLSFVRYSNPGLQYYNRSYWGFAAGNINNGFSVFARCNNPYNRKDFQNIIHYSMFFGYHQIPYPRFWSYGGAYFISTNTTGTK